MKLFLDTAQLNEIEEAYASGIVDGVTTNPSLMKKAVDALKAKGEDIDLEAYVKKILVLAKGTPVSLEVTSTAYETMVSEGRRLFARFNPIANNVYIKIPVNASFDGVANNADGIKAIRTLSSEGIPVNCTLVMTPEQALLAAKAGAALISPFAGRTDDLLRETAGMQFGKTDYYPAAGHSEKGILLHDAGIVSGVDLVRQCVSLMRSYGLKAQILAASIRNVRQLRECALAGADIATVPWSVLKEALVHKKTIEGMKTFTNDIVPEYAFLGK